jgi:methyl-accepting chemotaxis protein
VTNDMVSVSTVIDQSKLRSEQMTTTVNALSGRAEQLTARIGRFLEEIQAA